MKKIGSFVNVIRMQTVKIFYFGMVVTCLFLEWGSATRIGLLPRIFAWLPDLILLIVAFWMLLSLASRNLKISFNSGLEKPLLFIILLGIVTSLLNHQSIFNFLYGLWLYFRYWVWFYFMLWMGKELNFPIHFYGLIIFVTFLQIPLTLIQKLIWGLDRDLATGTIAGSQRLALIICVGLIVYLMWVIMIKRKPLWSFGVGLMIIPAALSESKFMFFVFPLLLLVILFILYWWSYISLKLAIPVFLMGLFMNLGSFVLYPVNAQVAITKAIFAPENLIMSQNRISNGVKEIPLSAYFDPEEMLLISKNKDLGRAAAFRFAYNNIDKLTQGGFLWGGGMASTSRGSYSFMNGSIQKAYPSFGFSRTLIIPIFLELGFVGLLAFAWLVTNIFIISFGLIKKESINARQTSLFGGVLIFVLLMGAIYTNLLASQSFMFVLSSGLAIVIINSKQEFYV